MLRKLSVSHEGSAPVIFKNFLAHHLDVAKRHSVLRCPAPGTSSKSRTPPLPPHTGPPHLHACILQGLRDAWHGCGLRLRLLPSRRLCAAPIPRAMPSLAGSVSPMPITLRGALTMPAMLCSCGRRHDARRCTAVSVAVPALMSQLHRESCQEKVKMNRYVP